VAATGAGVGYLPRLPGTLGTCLAIPISLGLNQLAVHSLSGSLLVLIVFTAGAVWLAGRAAARLAQKDPSCIIVDEIAGFMIANFLNQPKFTSVALAFILFRFFDIVKLFPANQAEVLPGGFGIVLDDVVAGLYAFLIVYPFAHWGFF
jgi:phosphatidylglycerophosphatase A